ncbi:hypothetical protein GXB85_05745 [Cellulomonas sp. APG4]|uniref:hypothetical protein n=1 Tax=Cellulomonas sp. APG4 TaxID=1538656 RepID=UPI001379580F|nr:hypothetical protein [Cellulomonas sp. APG4]NCT90452.1 hypothetical protein [Cellulomonas sp. APG4]
MSAATTTSRATQAVTAARPGPTFGRLLAAEWTKLTSLRSPWWIAGVTLVVAFAITYLSAEASSVNPTFYPLESLPTGLLLAQVGPLVLGALVGAGEFRTGAFRTTFTLVPRRWPVVAAQALVLVGFTLVLGVLTTAACAVGVLPSAASRDVPVDLTEGDTPGIMLGMVLFVVGLTLFGYALGALMRRTVPAVVTALTIVLILPVVLLVGGDLVSGPPGMAPAGEMPAEAELTVVDTLVTVSPGGAAQLLTVPASEGPIEGSPDLGPVGGGLVLAGWTGLVLGVAVTRLRTRDVR